MVKERRGELLCVKTFFLTTAAAIGPAMLAQELALEPSFLADPEVATTRCLQGFHRALLLLVISENHDTSRLRYHSIQDTSTQVLQLTAICRSVSICDIGRAELNAV